jgi:hypothetical protein
MAIVHQIGRDPADFGEICNNDGRGVCERISRVGALRRHRLNAPRQRDRREGADQWSRGPASRQCDGGCGMRKAGASHAGAIAALPSRSLTSLCGSRATARGPTDGLQ